MKMASRDMPLFRKPATTGVARRSKAIHSLPLLARSSSPARTWITPLCRREPSVGKR